MAEAYPLSWPVYYPKRPLYQRQSSNFNTKFAKARDGLLNQIRLMYARNVVLSTNVALRRDKLPYANQAQPQDTGVAVYFTRRDKQLCFACDKWRKVEDNIQALNKTIEALRGIERWGSSELMERAFTAFEVLPPAQEHKSWRQVLQFPKDDTPYRTAIEERFKTLAKQCHPDKDGGDTKTFQSLQNARDVALKELAGGSQ